MTLRNRLAKLEHQKPSAPDTKSVPPELAQRLADAMTDSRHSGDISTVFADWYAERAKDDPK